MSATGAYLSRCFHSNFLEAALDAGFGSYSQLHRVFVRLAGECAYCRTRTRAALAGGTYTETVLPDVA
jgi:hypothetical protein